MGEGLAARTFALAIGVTFIGVGVVRGATSDDKLSPAKVKELVGRVFAAKPEERDALLKDLPKQFGAADMLTAADAKKWLPLVVEAMRAPVKGRARLAATGTNYLYDEKSKRGKYIVAGDARAKQLVICLHGGGAGEGSAESAVSGFGGAFHKMDKTVVIYPEVLEKTEHGWTDDDTEQFILDLIETAKRSHPIDTNHVYITGHSMGGFGTWTLGARYADLFGGLAAFAGAPTPYFDPKNSGRVIGIQDGVLPNLMNLPIFVYQSGDDRNVPAVTNDFALPELDKLRAATHDQGYEHVYERVEGRGHQFPEKGPGPGVEWATRHARNPRPKKVVWQPVRAWKKSFYWIHSEKPSLGKTLTVEVTAPNTIDVTGDATSKGLTLYLDDRLVDLEKEVTVKVDGKEVFRQVAKIHLSTMVETAAERADAEYVFGARVDL
jgi:predicted esterase